MVKLFYYGFSRQLIGYCVKSSHKKKLKNLSNQLKTIASNKKSVSLAALQIGQALQYFVMLNNQYIKQNQWNSYPKLKPSHYRGILNAQIKDYSQQTNKQWQQCCSYPGIKMLIQRPNSIKVQYSDETLKDYQQQLHDFNARVFQHQIDHHFGQDYLKKALQIDIIDQNLKNKNQEQCNSLLKDYRKSLQKKKQQQGNSNSQNSSQQFNKLRQFITFTIVDKLRQK